MFSPSSSPHNPELMYVSCDMGTFYVSEDGGINWYMCNMEEMIGSMAAVPLPDGSPEPPRSALYIDALQEQLFLRGIEVPVIPWPAAPRRLLRVSAQAYNREEQYDRLAAALAELL